MNDDRIDVPRWRVTVVPTGWVFDTPSSVAVLAAARQAGIDLPASCRNGTCRTCMCRLVTGQVHYSIEWPGLSAEEKRDGFILPCVAHVESDLTIEVTAARALACVRS